MFQFVQKSGLSNKILAAGISKRTQGFFFLHFLIFSRHRTDEQGKRLLGIFQKPRKKTGKFLLAFPRFFPVPNGQTGEKGCSKLLGVFRGRHVARNKHLMPTDPTRYSRRPTRAQRIAEYRPRYLPPPQ
jgi:hypothetical protein